jgi:uncharacterized protein DUF4255
MALVVDVPLATTLADLDELLRKLLKRELSRHGFENVEIAFDAPSREWSGKLTGPTVNLFLYDIREAVEGFGSGTTETRVPGVTTTPAAPLRLEVTYAITGWAKAVEDEHRLLSQILSILHSFSQLPDDLLDGRAGMLGPLDATLGRPMEEKADFWSAVGGQYKPAVDYAVTLELKSGATWTRGPEVRTQLTRTRLREAPRAAMVEFTRFGGKVFDGEGEPVSDAWVAIPKIGAWTSTDRQGRFIFDRVEAGEYQVLVRAVEGEAEAKLKVPSMDTDIVLGTPKKGGGSTKKGGR